MKSGVTSWKAVIDVEINDKWVVHEKRDDVYFTGMDSSDYPVLERLNSRVRMYKSERSAKMAINRIGQHEYCEFEAVEIRLSENTYKVLEECSERLKITKAEVVHKGIAMVKAELDSKKE